MKSSLRGCLLILFTIALQSYSTAQDKLSLKFGKIDPADFDLSKHQFDSSAGAVYLADIGTSEFEGNAKGWFSLVHKRHARIKILGKSGFDLANVTIPLYTNGNSEEKLDNLKAATYYLENGKIVSVKLDEKTVFKDKYNKNFTSRKFTLPAVKEGVIIEFTYTITSDFLFNLQPWTFQGSFPRLWSEYTVKIPEFFNYVFLSQGYHPLHVNKRSDFQSKFTVIIPGGTSANSTVNLDGKVAENRFVMKDVPALKDETFTTSLKNHISKIEFQLSRIQLPNEIPQNIMADWVKVNESLLKDEDFGATLHKNNNWLDSEIKSITGNTADKMEKAKKIFSFVRDNFTITSLSSKYLSTSLKNTFKSRSGTVADINLLLIAMLNHEDIAAEPVLLSTRSHGYTHELYPLLDRFNYVVAKIQDGNNLLLLDATQPKIGFNHLPLHCFNGHARVIGKEPSPIFLDADAIKEKKTTLVSFNYDDKGQYNGNLSSTLGYYESVNIREKIAEKGKDEFFKEMRSSITSDMEISKIQIDSLTELDLPLNVKYNIKFPAIGSEDIIYLNPLMAEGYKDNYFKAATRNYPVEMPYTIDETFILNFQIPEGYVVDELPKQTRVAFNENEGSFEYLINKTDYNIQLRSRVKLEKANFTAEDYEGLRDFFAMIVKKHNEQIVFKKKK
jgi:hypothetical protein